MKNWLRKKILNIINGNDYERKYPAQEVLVGNAGPLQSNPTLQFKVYSAVGGKIVEFVKYDPRTDRRETAMYIVTNEQDFGERIAKIATMETLKN